MKVRTSLLFACMIVVPALAMFSHRVPAEVRSATRCMLWDPIVAWSAALMKPGAAEGSASGSGGGGSSVAAHSAETGASPPRQTSVAPHDSWSGAAGTSSQVRSGSPAARLADLGAVAVECRRLEAGSNTQVASCRVALDAAGQLHRVFQATGASQDEAVAALADEVERWRARLASRGLAPATSAETVRF